MTIYCGQPAPIKVRGRIQERVVEFALKYPGWHSYSKRDQALIRALKKLADRGILEVNEHGFR